MDIARQILAVSFVLALLAGALRALRRGGRLLPSLPGSSKRGRASALQVVGRVPLTPQHCLHIVRAGDREWVLATHPQGCTPISERSGTGAEA